MAMRPTYVFQDGADVVLVRHTQDAGLPAFGRARICDCFRLSLFVRLSELVWASWLTHWSAHGRSSGMTAGVFVFAIAQETLQRRWWCCRLRALAAERPRLRRAPEDKRLRTPLIGGLMQRVQCERKQLSLSEAFRWHLWQDRDEFASVA